MSSVGSVSSNTPSSTSFSRHASNSSNSGADTSNKASQTQSQQTQSHQTQSHQTQSPQAQSQETKSGAAPATRDSISLSSEARATTQEEVSEKVADLVKAFMDMDGFTGSRPPTTVNVHKNLDGSYSNVRY